MPNKNNHPEAGETFHSRTLLRDDLFGGLFVFDFLLGHVVLKFLCGYRLGIEIALDQITIGGPEKIDLFLTFDAFGDDRHIQRFGEVDNVFDNDVGAMGVSHIAEELTVYLQRVKRQLLEQIE